MNNFLIRNRTKVQKKLDKSPPLNCYTQSQIAEAVNSYSGYSYTDFVNKYRVEHVCRTLHEGKNKRLKLEGISYESGFGNKVNFYAAFRKLTGKTPAHYLANLRIFASPHK